MEQPQGPELSIWNLIPGEHYTAFSNQHQYMRGSSKFSGVFTEYWTNAVGYPMVRFHYTKYTDKAGSTFGHEYTYLHKSPKTHPHGLYWRIFTDSYPQSYRYYKTSRFTEKQKKELLTRSVLRERRQYERGLTGSTPSCIWFPRDLIHEISLRYLTDEMIGWKRTKRSKQSF
jgi:hypothetical protein